MGLLLEKRYCKECGICVAFCPRKILFLKEGDKIAVENAEMCISCHQCEILCPDFAISISAASEGGKHV